MQWTLSPSVAATRGARITRSQIEKAGSLYKLLNAEFAFEPVGAVDNLCAGVADDDDAQLLDIGVGDPLLMYERITLSDRRQPIGYCLMKYVSTYRYRIRIPKHRCGMSSSAHPRHQ